MTNRMIALTAVLLASACVAYAKQPPVVSLPAPSSSNGSKPNIVVILADDMGYSDLGSYGSAIATPQLDSLAQEGVRFTNFYNTGRCCPSRASFLTGLYPHRAGIGHMLGDTDFPGYSTKLNEEAVTLPEALKASGYATYMVGKWHLGWADEGSPNARGFDRFYGSRGYVDSYYTIVPGTDIYLDDEIVNPSGKAPVNHLHPDREFYTTDTYTDYAIHFIEEHTAAKKDQPFFMYVAHNAPHFPLHAKPEDTAKYRGKFKDKGWDPFRRSRLSKLIEYGMFPERTPLTERDAPDWNTFTEAEKDELDLKFALYCAIIDRLDQNVGRLVDALEENGQLDDTLIVFLSDNGATKETGLFGINGHDANPSNYEEWGRKGGWTSSLGRGWANVSNTPFRRYKRENHQGGIATPLIAWAGENVDLEIAAGSLSHQVGHIIDLYPTFLDMAGAKPLSERNGQAAPELAGKSLRTVFNGESIGLRTLYWEHEGNRAIRDGDWKLVARKEQDWELYDFSPKDRWWNNDKIESVNRVLVNAEKAKELEDKWNAWAAANRVEPWEIVYSNMRAKREAKKKKQ